MNPRVVSRKGFARFVFLLLAVSAIAAVAGSYPAAHSQSTPVNFGTTSDKAGLGYNSDGNVCGAQNLFWIFYSTGTSWVYKSSPDGVTWPSTASAIDTTVTATPLGTPHMAFYCSNTTVYLVGGDYLPTDDNLYYNTGTLNSNGDITWGTQQTITLSHPYVEEPDIIVDGSGNVWVVTQTSDGAGNSYLEVWENPGAAGVWYSSPGFPLEQPSGSPLLDPLPQFDALSSGSVALTYAASRSAIEITTFSGGSWSSPVATPGSTYNFDYSSVSPLGSAVLVCTTDGTNIYLLSFSGGAWSTLDTFAGQSCAMSTNTADDYDVVGLYYVTNDYTTVSYTQSNNGGSTFTTPVVLTSTGSEIFYVDTEQTVSTSPPSQALAVWVSGTSPPYQMLFETTSTSPSVTEDITITVANSGPSASATVTGCHVSPSSVLMNGSPQSVVADQGCTLTITVPSDTPYIRYRFAGESLTWSPTTGTTSPSSVSTTVYAQYSVTAYYSVSGSGAPPAPTFQSTEAGAPISATLTTTATQYWLDNGAAWSVSPSLTAAGTTWTTAPSSGTVTGPTTFLFVYTPPVTTTTTSTTTVTTTTTTTLTTTSVSTSTSTITSTSVSTTTQSPTVTSTVTVGSGSGSTPSASVLSCAQNQLQFVGFRVECTDIVYNADNGTAMGTVAWTSSGGTFSDQQCSYPTNYNFFEAFFGNNYYGALECQAQYTPSASGVQTVTATYSGDPYHSPSAATATLFVGNNQGSKVTSTVVSCSTQYLTTGQSTYCEATVSAAGGVTPTGSVTWSSSDHGSFSSASCNSFSFGGQLLCNAKYTPASAGADVVTATYTGDSSHSSSSGGFTIFVSVNYSALIENAILLSGGSLGAAGVGLVVLRRRNDKVSA